MAFVIPTFPLLCDIGLGQGPGGTPRLIDVPCQLRAPGAQWMGVIQPTASTFIAMAVLFPAGTDVRDNFCAPINTAEFIEIPKGTGRIYRVGLVDDIAKGFANEHRFAVLFKLLAFPWPVPIP